MESDTFPCLRCVFYNTLFGSLKAANFHLDHILPEYCTAYETDLAVIAAQNHPVAAIREFRRKATRKRLITWDRATVRPLDGTTWSFVVPAETEADVRAAVNSGLKSSAWWTKRLCEPIPPPTPLASARARPAPRPRTAEASVANTVSFKKVKQVNYVNSRAASSATITDHTRRASTPTDSDFEDTDTNSAAPAPAARRRRIATPSPQPVHRRARRRRVHFSPVSPFMRPGPPAPLTSLEVHVFGRIYPVPVTRGMALDEAMAALHALLTVNLDMDGFGLAAKDGGRPWTEARWDALKKEWMKGGKTEAWLVTVV